MYTMYTMYLEDWLPTDIDLIPIQCIPALPTLAGPMGNDGTTGTIV